MIIHEKQAVNLHQPGSQYGPLRKSLEKYQVTINIPPDSLAFAGFYFEYVGLLHVWAQSDDWLIALAIFLS